MLPERHAKKKKMSRSLNRVTLVGNLARDPEIRYTPSGTAVCTFTIVTNRYWKTDSGENKENAEFHRVVAWDKLGELCNQLLKKGARTFVEGRIQTRKWAGQDGVERYTTEIIITDMMVLDRKEGGTGEYGGGQEESEINVPDDFGESAKPAASEAKKAAVAPKKTEKTEEEAGDDIPF